MGINIRENNEINKTGTTLLIEILYQIAKNKTRKDCLNIGNLCYLK